MVFSRISIFVFLLVLLQTSLCELNITRQVNGDTFEGANCSIINNAVDVEGTCTCKAKGIVVNEENIWTCVRAPSGVNVYIANQEHVLYLKKSITIINGTLIRVETLMNVKKNSTCYQVWRVRILLIDGAWRIVTDHGIKLTGFSPFQLQFTSTLSEYSGDVLRIYIRCSNIPEDSTIYQMAVTVEGSKLYNVQIPVSPTIIATTTTTTTTTPLKTTTDAESTVTTFYPTTDYTYSTDIYPTITTATTTTTKPSNLSTVYGIVAGACVVLLLFLIVAVVFMCFFFRRKQRSNVRSFSKESFNRSDKQLNRYTFSPTNNGTDNYDYVSQSYLNPIEISDIPVYQSQSHLPPSLQPRDIRPSLIHRPRSPRPLVGPLSTNKDINCNEGNYTELENNKNGQSLYGDAYKALDNLNKPQSDKYGYTKPEYLTENSYEELEYQAYDNKDGDYDNPIQTKPKPKSDSNYDNPVE